MARGWLQTKFRDFILEVERQKAQLRSGRWAYQSENPVPFDPKKPGGRGPNPIWEALAALLRRQAEESGQSGAAGLQLYREAQYAMAALADEVFINLVGDWPGRNDWNVYPLELAFFNCRVAGQQIFKKIDELMARRDPAERDLAEIYFNILSLGFRGKFFAERGKTAPGMRGNGPIDELRRRLYNCFAEGREPATAAVSPQPYKYVESRKAGGELPGVLQSLVFLGIAVAFIAISGWGIEAALEKDVSLYLEKISDRIDETRLIWTGAVGGESAAPRSGGAGAAEGGR